MRTCHDVRHTACNSKTQVAQSIQTEWSLAVGPMQHDQGCHVLSFIIIWWHTPNSSLHSHRSISRSHLPAFVKGVGIILAQAMRPCSRLCFRHWLSTNDTSATLHRTATALYAPSLHSCSQPFLPLRHALSRVLKIRSQISGVHDSHAHVQVWGGFQRNPFSSTAESQRLHHLEATSNASSPHLARER